MSIYEEILKLNEEIKKCTRCPLYKFKTNYVPGDGNPESGILIIGEAPGRDEDIQGLPFVGKAGQYLNESLKRILDFDRTKFYITNVLKCRPPNNRDPKEDEILACSVWLEKQIEIIKPNIIITLGNHATKWIFNYFGIKFESISKHRGKLYVVNRWNKKIFIFPLYHPASTLYNNNLKEIFENDLRNIWEILNNKKNGILKFINK